MASSSSNSSTVGFLVVAAVLLASICPGETKKKAVLDVPVLCNSKNFTGDELPQARAERDRVLGRLVRLTGSQPKKSRFCNSSPTNKDDGKDGTTIFGLARCGGSFGECSACLNAARDLLKKVCGNSIGGQVNLAAKPKCFMRYEKRRIC